MLRVHIVADHFSEFLEAYYADVPHGDVVSARRDWVRDLVHYGRASGFDVTCTVANDHVARIRWWGEQSEPAPEGDAETAAVLAQIDRADPDVVLWTAPADALPGVLPDRLRARGTRLVIQCTQPLRSLAPLRPADLVATVSPTVAARYAAAGLPTCEFRYAFDTSVLNEIGRVDREPVVTFVGQLSDSHRDRITVLEMLARHLPLRWHGPRCDVGRVGRALARAWAGEAFGLDMYRALAAGCVGINVPPDFDPTMFGMFRTWEVIGLGLPLVMPERVIADSRFEPGRDFLTFVDARDAVRVCGDLLADPRRADEIGRRAQQILVTTLPIERAVTQYLETIATRLYL